MTVEITSIDIKEGIVTITAIDVSEENLQMLANYAQTECQFRYCGTAIPFLTV